MQRRYIIIIIAAVSIFGVVLFLLHELVLSAIGDFLVVQDKLEPADVIHVIASPDQQTDYAIQLYQAGYGKRIFFTGGWCRSNNFYHGQHGRERALMRGVPSKAIAVDESPVTSTYAEAVRLKEFIIQSQLSIHSVIVVSGPFHMRRTHWIYRQVLGDRVESHMAPVPFKLSLCKQHWWKDRISARMVGSEYAKIIYYYARYRLASGFLKGWLVSLDRN